MPIPQYAIDLDEKKSWQREVIGTEFSQLEDYQYGRISKEQYLQFACLFPIVGADDFRPPNLFLRSDLTPVTVASLDNLKTESRFEHPIYSIQDSRHRGLRKRSTSSDVASSVSDISLSEIQELDLFI